MNIIKLNSSNYCAQNKTQIACQVTILVDPPFTKISVNGFVTILSSLLIIVCHKTPLNLELKLIAPNNNKLT